MKKKWIVALLASVMILNTGCKGNEIPEPVETVETPEPTQVPAEEKPEEVPVEEEVPVDEAVTGGGSPWINSDLKENISDAMALSLKDDFHLYNNYDWLKDAQFPEGYAQHGPFTEVALDTEAKAVDLLKDDTLTGHDAELIRSLYNAVLDWDARDAAGVSPIQAAVDDIRSLSSIEDIDEFICDPERSFGVPCFMAFYNGANINDSTSYILSIGGEGFLLGDAAEYSQRTEMGDLYYEAQLYLAQEMLPKVGYTRDEAKAMFDSVIDLESRLAEVSLTTSDMMSPDYYDKINNILKPDEAWALAPAFPGEKLINAFGYGKAKEIMVPEPEWVKRLNELYTDDNLEQLKDYMLVKYVVSMAPILDSSSYDAYVNMSNMLSGSEGRVPDESMAFDLVRSYLTTPMDRAYLERYDATEAKKRITEVCRNVADAYRSILSEEDWLSEETRAAAIEKLDNLKINAVYPDKWEDYSSMDLTGLSYYECYKVIGDHSLEENAKLTNGKIDKDIWGFDILEANAYYSPVDNSINIILGLLGDPFYYDGMSDEELMGGIGMVIGHEISHAFDTSGAQFDKDGNYAFWWTEEDYMAFMERAQKLIDHYNTLTVWEGQNVLGDNVQTEAIADMGGMKAMLTLAKEKDGFDYDKFFTSYAHIWAFIRTRETELQCIMQDSHPLPYMRTNVTVQQYQEFHDTYDIKEGDGMYLAPEDRITVW
ncbi:MAG: M13 family metallopeptidase [Lachnospiraceae bacterium]|nr:M13 family metallopeptidase [Lachnospiraceae bacterium]